MKTSSVCFTFAVLTTMLISSVAHADVRLPGFFSDHMVLQQQSKIKIWGWSDAGDEVTVSIGENSAVATTNDDGKWQVELAPMEASKTPVSLVVKGGHNEIKLTDLLIGEVWLCSGQSNMEWTVARSVNAEQEIAAADYPLIRHIKIPREPSSTPVEDLNATWQVCSPKTAGNFTACGYFMARKLAKELDVPVGLINSSWGGTRVEPWTPPVGFEKVEALKSIHESVIGRTPGSATFKSKLSSFIADSEKWLAEAKDSLERGLSIGSPPEYPGSLKPYTSHQDPTMLYNGMIHGMVGFPIRGAIWYQGESNHNEGMLYFEKKKALINGWRELWGQGDFPFYFVQIAPYQYGNEDPSILARFWEAQAETTTLPKVEMVVINDIATLNDIHPPNKQDVGLRLANLALKFDYGKAEVVALSPEVESHSVENGNLKVRFKNVGGGLKTRDGNAPTHFEIVGKGSNGFQPATASFEGDAVIVLKSEKVSDPTAFRFAWDKLAEPNLTGGTGLPVGACRGGKVPGFLDVIPVGEYDLVYELNLAKLGDQIKYDRNNSASIGAFDRIGYLLELNSSEYGDQKLFVTMDAFTDNVKAIGVPTVESKAVFQQKVSGLEVFANSKTIKTGKIGEGNIEFWPNNYGPGNGSGVPGASGQKFDFGDTFADPEAGYGSMQVHNFKAKQTLFAINHWSQGNSADIGIGNGTGDHSDWTFSSSGSKYSAKKLRIYVRQK
ncbi:sialate O-acetylesterase [Mariniblastus fucicola]|nr:sialate O-acetylesterase [Mariniblastus fucicola]